MHRSQPPPDQRTTVVRAVDVFRLLTFGWYFAGALGVGMVGGWALDSWLDTKPGFLIGGLAVGSAAGFLGMFGMLLPLYKGGRTESGETQARRAERGDKD